MSDKEYIENQLGQLNIFLDKEELEHISDIKFTSSYEESDPEEYCQYIDGEFDFSYKYKDDIIRFTGKYKHNQSYENRYDPNIYQKYYLYVNDKQVDDFNNLEDYYADKSDEEYRIIDELVEYYKSDPIDIMQIELKEPELKKFVVVHHDSYSGAYKVEYYKAPSISKVYRHFVEEEDVQVFLDCLFKYPKYNNENNVSDTIETVKEGENGSQFFNLSEEELKDAFENKTKIMDKLCDKSIKNIFMFYNTPGEGAQVGDSGREWYGKSIFEYNPDFQELS